MSLVSCLLVLSARPALAQPMLVLPDNREGWPFGTCVHQTVQEDGPATTALDDLGAPWVRIDVNWNGVETAEGVYDWTVTDDMVTTARAHGYIIFATLAYTPAWATDGTERNGVPRAAELYESFVTAVVERYSAEIRHWGLWNEPEQGRFWSGTPEQFVDLILRPGFEAVRAADPGALVLGPDSGSDQWLDDIFSAGGGDYLDIITVHVYACCDASDDVAKVLWRLDCTGGWPWDSCRRRVIERHGLGDRPVWVTEVGWKTLTPDWETRQAELYVGLLDAMLERPWWRMTFFYELYDATDCDPSVDNCWGIVRTDWSRKPAFEALRSYIVAHQPRADAGADVVAAVGEPVGFGGSASHDPDGAIVRYRWDFDREDGVFEEAEGETVERTFSSEGIYVVTLVVTDDDGLEDGDEVVVIVGDGPARPTLRATHASTAPVVDGELGEWSSSDDAQVGTESWVTLTALSSGDADLSARVVALWDESNLYLAAIVTDDSHRNVSSPDQMWAGDSWQIAFDADGDRTAGTYDSDGDTEVGVALLDAGASTVRWTAPEGAPGWSPTLVARSSDGAALNFELAIPWSQLPPFSPSGGASMGFSFVFNDDDGGGREGFVEWTPGIGLGKDPSSFGTLVLVGGQCETDIECVDDGGCAAVPPPCSCLGQMECNAAGRCERICDPGGDADTDPDGGAHDADVVADGGTNDADDIGGDGETLDSSPDDGGTVPSGGGGCQCSAGTTAVSPGALAGLPLRFLLAF